MAVLPLIRDPDHSPEQHLRLISELIRLSWTFASKISTSKFKFQISKTKLK